MQVCSSGWGLSVLKVDKELSFGEHQILNAERTLLFKKLSLVIKGNDVFQESELKEIFGIDVKKVV